MFHSRLCRNEYDETRGDHMQAQLSIVQIVGSRGVPVGVRNIKSSDSSKRSVDGSAFFCLLMESSRVEISKVSARPWWPQIQN